MINIRQVENDFVNQYTIATVDIYEVMSGIKRVRDTFLVTLPGVHELMDPTLDDMILAKLAEIGYNVVVTQDPTTPSV